MAQQKHDLIIQAVSIIGGILTAIFFLGFLFIAEIIRSEGSCAIVGSIFILATIAISRTVTRSFLDAINITLYIAGCSLVGFSLMDTDGILFVVLIGISVLTFLASRGFILPFLSVILFIISLFSEAAHLFSSSYPLQVAAVPLLAAYLLSNLFEEKQPERLGDSFPKYYPLHYGLFVSCFISLGGLSIQYLTPEAHSQHVSCILSVFIWIGILIMAQRIMKVMEVDNAAKRIGVYVFCLIICVPTLYAPYLSGSLLLILICFHYGYKAECAAALLLFIYSIAKYYYDLHLSLLTKSITLIVIGVACIAAWYFFTQKRIRHEKV